MEIKKRKRIVRPLRDNLIEISIKSKQEAKDSEGNVTVEFVNPVKYNAILWNGKGNKLEIQMYGEKVNTMLNMKIFGNFKIKTEESRTSYVYNNNEITVGDGVCVNVEETKEPDFTIIAAIPYQKSGVLYIELQRV